MKKIYKTSCKIWLAVLCSICGIITLIGLLGTVVLAEYGVYGSNDWKQDLEKRAGDAYAIWAIANYHGGELWSDIDTDLTGTGFCYGIIKGKYENQDLSDGKTYVDRNFTGNVPSDYLVRTFYLSERPSYYLSDRLLADNRYYAGETTENKEVECYGIGFDLIDNTAYVWDGKEFHPLYEEFAYPIDAQYYEGTTEDEKINKAYEQLWKNAAEKDADSKDGLRIGKRTFPSMKDSGWDYVLYIAPWNQPDAALQAQNIADLSSIHDELASADGSSADLGTYTSIRAEVKKEGNAYYTVVYFPKDAVHMEDGWKKGSLYTQAAILESVIPVLMIACPIAMVVCFALALWMLVLLLCAAGHRYGEEGIHACKAARIPMDLMIVLVGACELALLYLCEIGFFALRSTTYPAFLGGGIMTIAVFAGCMIGLGWLMTVAVNVKLGHWWKNTILYRIFAFLKKHWAGLRSNLRQIRSRIRWSVRVWLIFALFVFLELFGLAALDAREELVFVWFFEKILFGVGLYFLLKYYGRLKDTVVKMAEGDMNVKVDTTGMPLDFEEHGKALNTIGSGMSTAISERIKSERMKTELITNVSHDIKTPLTSIINYVDLLQKEQIENDKAKEYLEVLDRQAKRLKKLIEDLIEASKAATGNIKFQMESVNARMILNQSIGEFEERLAGNQITLVSNVPEEDVYVWADNRYLWRVFDNLMNNIVKYAQPGTRAYVDMTQSEGTITFTFRNTSKNELNISADELMERFVRGDASRNTEGNGLGLSIARSLTESMDGKMDLAIDGDLFKVILTFKAQ